MQTIQNRTSNLNLTLRLTKALGNLELAYLAMDRLSSVFSIDKSSMDILQSMNIHELFALDEFIAHDASSSLPSDFNEAIGLFEHASHVPHFILPRFSALSSILRAYQHSQNGLDFGNVLHSAGIDIVCRGTTLTLGAKSGLLLGGLLGGPIGAVFGMLVGGYAAGMSGRTIGSLVKRQIIPVETNRNLDWAVIELQQTAAEEKRKSDLEMAAILAQAMERFQARTSSAWNRLEVESEKMRREWHQVQLINQCAGCKAVLPFPSKLTYSFSQELGPLVSIDLDLSCVPPRANPALLAASVPSVSKDYFNPFIESSQSRHVEPCVQGKAIDAAFGRVDQAWQSAARAFELSFLQVRKEAAESIRTVYNLITVRQSRLFKSRQLAIEGLRDQVRVASVACQ